MRHSYSEKECFEPNASAEILLSRAPLFIFRLVMLVLAACWPCWGATEERRFELTGQPGEKDLRCEILTEEGALSGAPLVNGKPAEFMRADRGRDRWSVSNCQMGKNRMTIEAKGSRDPLMAVMTESQLILLLPRTWNEADPGSCEKRARMIAGWNQVKRQCQAKVVVQFLKGQGQTVSQVVVTLMSLQSAGSWRDTLKSLAAGKLVEIGWEYLSDHAAKPAIEGIFEAFSRFEEGLLVNPCLQEGH
jgi:hypothetical protein